MGTTRKGKNYFHRKHWYSHFSLVFTFQSGMHTVIVVRDFIINCLVFSSPVSDEKKNNLFDHFTTINKNIDNAYLNNFSKVDNFTFTKLHHQKMYNYRSCYYFHR